MREYEYVGPFDIQHRSLNSANAKSIESLEGLIQRLCELGFQCRQSDVITVTFVIDTAGRLRVADRHSEHVACALGRKVLSAGEMTFGWDADGCFVQNVTNQSTGYCPEESSWIAVEAALDRIVIRHPLFFEPAMCFRRCLQCGQTNLIKDENFVCAVCEAILPVDWNFS